MIIALINRGKSPEVWIVACRAQRFAVTLFNLLQAHKYVFNYARLEIHLITKF